ncbi:UNVERIFIED_CONTAM: hypothetical protein PYX00_007278 [Menopon gallinae]|uniref:Uncharacterized protein n=1 Tax=Menopon gallinae TaxID=328185 RepID=A0AAW2HIN2_9NEOP
MKSLSGLAIFIALIVAEVVSFPFLLEIEEGFIREIDTAHKCRQCTGEECLIPPEPCRYGSYFDRCGHVNCYQGPRNFCNPDPTGAFRCAKQLSCLCNECQGCLKDPEDGEYHCYTASSCSGMGHRRPDK